MEKKRKKKLMKKKRKKNCKAEKVLESMDYLVLYATNHDHVKK